MIRSNTNRNPFRNVDFSFFFGELFSKKYVKIRPVFLLCFIVGLLVSFYFSLAIPEVAYSIVVGLGIFMFGFIISNLFYLNASGKKEDVYNRMIINQSSDLFLIYKVKNGRFKYVSPSIENVLGYDLTAVLNQVDLSFIHPADRFGFYNILEKEYLSLNRHFCETVRMIKRDGEIIWVTIKGDVMVDASNNLEYVVMNLRDITESKERAIAQKQYQKSLEQAIQTSEQKLYKIKANGNEISKIRQLDNYKVIDDEDGEKPIKIQPDLNFKKLRLNM